MTGTESRADAERRRQRRIRWTVLPIVLLVSAALVGLTVSVIVLAQRNSAKDVALSAQREQATQAGQTPVARDPKDINRDPSRPLQRPTSGPAGARGERGPGPTDAQVDSAVAAYFANHDAVSPGAIAVYVGNYLRSHPPGPTPGQVSDSVASYLREHPAPSGSPGAPGKDGTSGTDGAAGPAGPQGERGPGPTADEVASGVRSYMTDHPLPVCPDGSRIEEHSVLTADGGGLLGTGRVDALICVKD